MVNKKTLLTLALAGLIATSCSDKNIDLFQKIAKDKCFKLDDYKEYLVGATNNNFEGVAYVGYDFNNDGKPDVIAMAKIFEKLGKGYLVEPYAFAVSVNKNEIGAYDTYYFDKDGDGKFDMVLQNDEKEKPAQKKGDVII
jgi:hypothetical protein